MKVSLGFFGTYFEDFAAEASKEFVNNLLAEPAENRQADCTSWEKLLASLPHPTLFPAPLSMEAGRSDS